MEKTTFAHNLLWATRRAIEIARRYVLDDLPDDPRYLMPPIVPENHAPLDICARKHPNIRWDVIGPLPPATHVQLVDYLWHDGYVPEWIHLLVDRSDRDFTYLEVQCKNWLWRDGFWEGTPYPPFRVLGPWSPRSWWPFTAEEALARFGRFRLSDPPELR